MPRRRRRRNQHAVGFNTVSFNDVASRILRKRKNAGCLTCCLPYGQAKLHAAATFEGFRQMFEREVVNTGDHRAGTKWRSSELNVQEIHWMATQLGRECQWHAHQRRMGERRT